jgi:hypothetical protein
MDKSKRYYFGAYDSYPDECMREPHCEFHKMDNSPGNEALYCDNPDGAGSLGRCPLSLVKTIGQLMNLLRRVDL